jgi:hypothetical protein
MNVIDVTYQQHSQVAIRSGGSERLRMAVRAVDAMAYATGHCPL